MTIGLTGRIGAGKTTVSKLFEKKGFFVIDADTIGYEVLEENKEKIIKAFGTIERKALSNIVFKDVNKLKKLEKLTHPLIFKKIKEIIKNKEKTIIVAPLLIESSLNKLVDKRILVVCKKKIILERLKNAGTWKIAEIERRMRFQPKDKERKPYVDFIIDNNSEISHLEAQVDEIINRLRFKFIEHTADIGVCAFGKTLSEAFSNTAYGMFSVIAELSNVNCKEKISVFAKGKTREELLVNCLSELLYCFTGRGLLLKEFETEIKGKRVYVIGWGEELNSSHTLRKEIKTVTYHNIKIEKTKGGFQTQVIFDV